MHGNLQLGTMGLVLKCYGENMNDFSPFSLADTLLNAERIKRLRMENEMFPEVRQQQLADRKMQNYQGVLQTASQVARNIQREMGKSGLTPDNPEFQQRLNQVSAPFRPIFDALHYEVTGNRAEQGPIDWIGIS